MNLTCASEKSVPRSPSGDKSVFANGDRPAVVDKREWRIRRMFGNIAPCYDFLNHLLSLNIDHYWRWRTARLAPPIGNGPMLDLCTGTGDLAFAYARACGGRVPIIGADFCHAMLAIAKRKAEKRLALNGFSLVEADAQHLPFPDRSFQLVSIAFGLRNVTDTDRGLAEIVRVLRSGGQAAILEFSRPRQRFLGHIYQYYFRHVLPKIGQAISRSRDRAYCYLPASVGEFPDGEALAERMRRQGLVDVTWRPLTFGIATIYVGRRP